ncbi:MAG TPA: BA14K family protein [Mesorhizobium sp.]|jgi:TolA-binding protein|nr:BA14K family protein [Mesorhizobium sp.]
MKKLLSALCASGLAVAMTATSIAPVSAAPVAVPLAFDAPADLHQVQLTNREIRRLRRLERRDDRIERREDRVEDRIDDLRDQDDLTPRQERRLERLENRERRLDRREARVEGRQRDIIRRGDNYYYKGYRGYRDYRRGYRRHGDFWFPAAAFIAGAVITGAIASQPRTVIIEGSSNAHIEWCYNRYRSYRASDNTFQPYNGPRRQCYSPYS